MADFPLSLYTFDLRTFFVVENFHGKQHKAGGINGQNGTQTDGLKKVLLLNGILAIEYTSRFSANCPKRVASVVEMCTEMHVGLGVSLYLILIKSEMCRQL